MKSSYAEYGPATAYAPAGWDGSYVPPNCVVLSEGLDGQFLFYASSNGVRSSGTPLIPRYLAANGETFPYILAWDNINGKATVTIKGQTFGPISAPILTLGILSLIIIGPDNYPTPPLTHTVQLRSRPIGSIAIVVNGQSKITPADILVDDGSILQLFSQAEVQT